MDDEALRKELLSRFPEDALLDVAFKRHGDSPGIEPHEVVITLVPRGPEEHNADPFQAPREVRNEIVQHFTKTQEGVVARLQKDLPRLVPEPER